MKRESLARFQALLPPLVSAHADRDTQVGQALALVVRMKDIAAQEPSPLASPRAHCLFQDHLHRGLDSLSSCFSFCLGTDEEIASLHGVLEDACDDLVSLLEEPEPWTSGALSMSQSPRRVALAEERA